MKSSLSPTVLVPPRTPLAPETIEAERRPKKKRFPGKRYPCAYLTSEAIEMLAIFWWATAFMTRLVDQPPIFDHCEAAISIRLWKVVIFCVFVYHFVTADGTFALVTLFNLLLLCFIERAIRIKSNRYIFTHEGPPPFIVFLKCRARRALADGFFLFI